MIYVLCFINAIKEKIISLNIKEDKKVYIFITMETSGLEKHVDKDIKDYKIEFKRNINILKNKFELGKFIKLFYNSYYENIIL